jgi:NADH:ubiquinone oxidoreductase subunit 4 (subunit M)
LNEQILQACKELVDDAKQGCADLVFKEVCLEILSRASHVLTQRQFKQLIAYTSDRMRERMSFEFQQKLAMNK